MAGILGLFATPEAAAEATDKLKAAGFSNEDYDVLTGTPYPEEAFGEPMPKHKLYIYPIIGALCGLAGGILITGGTQLTYPLVTGGKPILSIPPMIVITYEGTMLGAILFTILGLIFESRLPNLKNSVYDKRITQEGFIGLTIDGDSGQVAKAEKVFKDAGAVDIVKESA